MSKVKIGIIGCGNISDIYLKNCTQVFSILDVVAVADIIPERAREKAEKYGISKFCSVEELLADKEIQIVVNLTIPKAHTEICLAALSAGKHVYVEKPLSIDREDAKKIVEEAKNRNLMVGCAPDTFLGAGLQTCRKLIDDGWIGIPVAATAFMTCHGHESWHPDPEFYYKKGGGPMLDMGPYYLTALVSLMGSIKRITASTKITYSERTITSKPKLGTKIEVEVPTHVAGVMDFECGAVGTIITSFDIWSSNLPRIEIYGSEGSLSVPDPNTFGGPVKVKRAGQNEWMEIPFTHSYNENSRGLGVVDMAYAILNERNNRANGELAYHVLDIMQGFQEASEKGSHYTLSTSCKKPEPLPLASFEADIFK